MAQLSLRRDPNRFVHYYVSQSGGNLPGFYGAPVMYGRGIGSLFSKLFRFVSPLVKKGFAIAKPHLKTAASNIASDVIGRAVRKMSGSAADTDGQEGSGIMVLSKRPRTRPPGNRLRTVKKQRQARKKRSVGADKRRGRKSTASFDIFK